MVGVVVVAPKRGDLEQIAGATNGHGPEAVLVDRAWKQLEEPLRSRVRSEVPVGGRSAERDVAKGATHDVGAVADVPERFQQRANRIRDRALEGRQLRPRKR